MATIRTANARWEGGLTDGRGRVSLDSSGIGAFEVTWPSRAEQPDGRTSPEELIAAAHAACFSMALSAALGREGHAPQALNTKADVTFQPGEGITGIRLTVRGLVDGLDDDAFVAIARQAKDNCPVSKALAGTTITLDAALA